MKIAVLGCGWLGLPLAKRLVDKGCTVVGSKRTKQDVDELNQHGICGLQYSLGDDLTQDSLAKVFSCDVLVLNIPVGRKSQAPEAYVEHMAALLKQAKKSEIQSVIFISTTSVYGEETRVVTEASEVNPITQSAKINHQIEGLVRAQFADKATIIRLAGLVGGQRHPGKFLAGKSGLANPHQVVNLVHLHDVLNAIESVIQQKAWGHTLLLSAAQHPSRQDYYVWAATQLGLAPPVFEQADVSKLTGKQVDCQHTLDLLGLTLVYPSPYDMLNA